MRLAKTNGRSPSGGARVARHDVEARAHERRQIDLVDDEQIRSRDAGAALARDLVAARDINHINGGVHKLRAETRGEVVAAAFEKNQIEMGMALRQFVERVEVQRRVLANRGVRTAAGLHAQDAIRGQRFAPHEKLHVFAREDVVGDNAELILATHPLAERVHKRRLAGAHGPADAEPYRPGNPWHDCHDRNNRECTYCWLIAARSRAGANADGARSERITASTTSGARASVAASSACASC